MSALATHPLVLWLAALLALAIGMRATRTTAPARNRPPTRDGIVLRLASMPVPPGLLRFGRRAGTAEQLHAAGLADRLSVAQVERARVAAALVAAAPALLLALLVPAAIVLAPALGLLGHLAPDHVIRARARARRAAIVRELPDLLDLLTICVESGMALDPALHVAATRLPGVLAGEVAAALRELSLGTPRRAAYRTLVERAGSPEVAQVVAALLDADELGAPLSSALAGQAESLRAARRQAIRDRAAKAAPKIQLVVALIMVPAALLLVLGVLVIELARQVGAVVG